MKTMIPLRVTNYKINPLNHLQVSEKIDLGFPITHTQFIGCTFGKEDGHDMLYTAATGNPASLVCYDIIERKILREIPLPGAHTCWSHGTDSKGNVYIATQTEAKIFKWDPIKKELTDYGFVITPDGITQIALYGVAFDDEDNAYVGTYPGAYLVRLNAKTGQYEYVTNKMCPNEKYIRSIFTHNGYLYAMGNSQDTNFSRYDLKTGKIENLTKFNKDGDNAITCQGMVGAGDYLTCFMTTKLHKQIVAIYKISENRWLLEDDKLIPSMRYYTTPEHKGRVYIANSIDEKMYEFNIETEEMKKTNYTAVCIRNAKFFEFNTPSLPGATMVTVHCDGYITYNNFDSGVCINESAQTAQPIDIRCLQTGPKGSDSIVISAYMGSKMAVLNDSDGEIRYIGTQQIEGMGEAHGEFYLGNYPGGSLATVDFDKGVRNIFGSIAFANQDRPFRVIEAGDYVAYSSVANYGILGGALTLVEPQTKRIESFENIIKNQSIIGLAYRDGKIYGTTSVWGGLGIDPSEEYAKIFIFDLTSKRVIKEAIADTVNLNGRITQLGDISFAPDGSLWTVCKSGIFEVDAETLKIIRKITVVDSIWEPGCPGCAPYSIRWLNETVMITTSGDCLSAVDISTGEFKILDPCTVLYMTLSERNNIYYTTSDRGRLYKMLINIEL